MWINKKKDKRLRDKTKPKTPKLSKAGQRPAQQAVARMNKLDDDDDTNTSTRKRDHDGPR